ncbi:MAG: VOC family protein [Acidimicrobiales bacterium]
MAHGIQLTFDAGDPPALAEFWGLVLGYVPQPPPPGFDTWEDFGAANNIPEESMGDYGAVIDPDGVGPRLLFLKVPEAKTGKNRMHMDISVPDRVAHVARLVEAGATEVATRSEFGAEWTVMEDPEGNVFCVATELA